MVRNRTKGRKKRKGGCEGESRIEQLLGGGGQLQNTPLIEKGLLTIVWEDACSKKERKHIRLV